MKFIYCKSSIMHDLQLLLSFSTLYPRSFWKIDTIMFAKFKYPPPPWNKPPSLLSSTPSNVFEINKPPREHSLEELQNSSLILSSSFLGILRTIFMANTNLVYQLNWLEHHSIIDFKISDIDKLILALIFRFGVIIWSKTFFFMNY